MRASTLELATFWITLVGTVATVGALIAAIAIGLHEVRAIRRENRDRDAERREAAELRKRAQAECVSGVLRVQGSDAHRLTGQGLAPSFYSYAEIINASALPIYDVEALVTHSDHPGMVSRDSVPFIAGGGTGHVHTPAQPDDKLDGHPIDVRFRDAGNRLWHRHRDGLLHEQIEGQEHE